MSGQGKKSFFKTLLMLSQIDSADRCKAGCVNLHSAIKAIKLYLIPLPPLSITSLTH